MTKDCYRTIRNVKRIYRVDTNEIEVYALARVIPDDEDSTRLMSGGALDERRVIIHLDSREE